MALEQIVTGIYKVAKEGYEGLPPKPPHDLDVDLVTAFSRPHVGFFEEEAIVNRLLQASQKQGCWVAVSYHWLMGEIADDCTAYFQLDEEKKKQAIKPYDIHGIINVIEYLATLNKRDIERKLRKKETSSLFAPIYYLFDLFSAQYRQRKEKSMEKEHQIYVQQCINTLRTSSFSPHIPQKPIPPENTMFRFAYEMDTKDGRESFITRPLEKDIIDMLTCLQEKGHLTIIPYEGTHILALSPSLLKPGYDHYLKTKKERLSLFRREHERNLISYAECRIPIKE